MPSNTTRRGLLGALLAGGVGGAALSPVRSYLDRFAPASGRAWASARRPVPGEVESPYGPATITYDDHGVPHVDADEEAAAYFAVGYVQAADRLFEMDLVRRLMRGELAAVVGEAAAESDEFHARMDFLGAARASQRALDGTPAARMTEAYADGVDTFVEAGPLPLEFGLLGYEPEPWRPVDSLVVGRRISWGLTGSFATLRTAVLRDELGDDAVDRLFPTHLDHDAPILRDADAPATDGRAAVGTAGTSPGASRPDDARVGDAVDAGLADWLGEFEPPPYLGSNSWVVSGDHTESGQPVVCNDPHLTLQAPPVWYEQRIAAGDVDVRGVAFPGIPFVVIGENRHGAWGFTNVGADVMDLYTYDVDGDRYRYRGEWREFETETRTIEVDGGDDREIELKKTVHGPYLQREVDGEQRHVGVAWTGLSATREAAAVHEFSRTTGAEEFREALRTFNAPTQNAVYADRDGRTLYHVTGRIPIRRIDGAVVRGDRVFDGSAGEAEWEGYEPYGESTWDGFVPFEEKPGVLDADYVATANQRVVDDPAYPLGQAYAAPFRGARIYERLDRTVGAGETVDAAFLRDLQTDALDRRARLLVPAILDASDRMPDGADEWLDALDGWDYRMTRDSRAALFFERWFGQFRAETWGDEFGDLDDSYYPNDWVLATLPPDSEFFDGDRAGVLASAAEATVAEIDEAGWETYGDYNRTAIDHPFGGQVDALNYPRYPTDGSPYTVMNFRKEDDAGSSWRMVASPGDESFGIVPGGNDGSYFSDHYDDQLRAWADGEYRRLGWDRPEGTDVTVREGDG